MRVKALAAATLMALSLPAFASSPNGAAELRTSKAPIEGRYIVVLKEDAASLASEASAIAANGQSKPSVAAVAREFASSRGKGRANVVHAYQHVLRGFVVEADDEALARVLADPRVDYVEEDGIVSISATQNNATWGLDRIDQRNLPLNSTYVYDATAANVHAYVIDTGIRASHNDFGGRVGSGYTAINDGNGTNDCNGHGTHVAGTVGGTTWGVAKQARLYPVRVLGCNGNGAWSGVIDGMDWVAGNHTKPAVANMSLGGGATSSIDEAVTRMRNAGVTVVVAAGNDSSNACNYSPARSSSAITVGSTMNNDSRSIHSTWSSNYGSCVNIFAPGSSITSAWHTSNTATNSIGGTSMASPHVAGVAALYLAGNPGATPSQVESAIYNNATLNVLSNIGSGSPNRMLYSLFGGGTDPDPDPDPDPQPGELQNGVPVAGLSGASGSEQFFTLDVPSGATNLVFRITGGSGDADMYVRRGAQPTTSSYDCRPYLNGNEESCSFASPQAGTWHVMLRGYSAYSGVSLTGSFDTGSGGAPCTSCTKYSGSLSGAGSSQVQPNGTYYQSASGTHQGWLKGPAGTDFDLELYRWNGSGWTRVAQSAGPTSEESISYNGTAGYYYWRILSYSGSGSYDFWLQRP
ncbi:S8 family peptidase [Lysobacter alkalisoli]|uniref:S8 family peptidase n=2 Tax=Marilutibacter alkalisoli TaxID=2591633 RepID=A0A514BWS6_9GAMM|nr:S8 family peptidase [Lysobacter alkalisoli]